MQSKRYAIIFVLINLFFVVVNAVVSFVYYNSQTYFEYDGNLYARDVLIKANQYISDIEYSEYGNVYNILEEEYKKLDDYLKARIRISDEEERYQYYQYFSKEEAEKIVKKYSSSISEAEARNRMDYISLCMKQIWYASEYTDYLETVRKNADEMNKSDIFSPDIKKKILHTGSVFYQLENVTVTAVSDESVKMTYKDISSDILSIVMVVVCSFVLSLWFKNDVLLPDKKRCIWFAVMILISVCCIYGFNIFCADYILKTGNFERAVQSIRDFKLCSLKISVGEFLLLRVMIKISMCMIVFFICISVFLSQKRFAVLLCSAMFLTVEIIRYFIGSDVNFITFRSPEKILKSYNSTRIFREYINTYILYMIYVFALLILSLAVAIVVVRTSHALACEKAEKDYFDEINQKYNESRFIRHDIKNHLSAIAVLIDSGDTEGARKYICEITGELEKIKPPVKTGSGVLDALLFKKYNYANSQDIEIYTEFASDFSSCRFSDYDLCGIFSNILDNAFEACQKIKSEKKFVTLSVKEQMNMVCIICENPYSEIRRESGGIVTLKNDRDAHGFGLKRILQIDKKYDGSVDINTDDKIFSVSILMIK